MRGSPGTKTTRSLRRSAVLWGVAVVIASVFAFGAIEYFANIIMGWNRRYNPVTMIGMIGPMGILMGLISYASWRATSRYTTRLIQAIDMVSEGNFGVRLDDLDAGHYREVYLNFNAMCEELQKVQTLRDDFINHFSHEFKTPITSISGFARLLLEESASEEEKRRYLEIIASESERLAELSSSALLMTKLDSQQHVFDKEDYALDEQIKQCVILLSPQWSKKGIAFSADLESVVYRGDADLVRQVWINLLGNAIKFSPDRGEISVGLKADRGTAVVTVSDRGKGMTKEELSRAFEKYYQGDTARSSKGLGLGLAIVKRIVELCGGRVEARSQLGEGSAFTVYLPLRE